MGQVQRSVTKRCETETGKALSQPGHQAAGMALPESSLQSPSEVLKQKTSSWGCMFVEFYSSCWQGLERNCRP